MTSRRTLPRYRDLPDGTSFAVFGRHDQLGCLNLLTPERVRAAAKLIISGRVVSLNGSLDWPDPPPFASVSGRAKPTRNVIRTENGRDEYLDGFYPQSGSQWDGFLHQRDPQRQAFYNGNTDETRGMQIWAEHGIVGRGVLLDVEGWVQTQGRSVDWTKREVFSVRDLEACALAQGTRIEEGTILVLRLGWESGFNSATPAQRQAFAEARTTLLLGIEGTNEMVERLWDWGVAAVATDSVALEAFPTAGRMIHVDLLSRLGIPIGELWSLGALAEACSAAGRYEFFLTSAPLNIPGGTGSTANALAIL